MPPKARPRFDRAEWGRLRRDLERFSRRFASVSPLRRAAIYWGSPQYRTLVFYRLQRAFNLPVLRAVLGALYRRSARRSGVELGPRIGGGVILPHWGRIILDAQSIGHDLYALHNVTVGTDYASEERPVIGNDVFIGTGATVVGDIRIGDHVVIGAMSFVNSDVPSCSLVAGNPARVLRAIDPEQVRKMTGYG